MSTVDNDRIEQMAAQDDTEGWVRIGGILHREADVPDLATVRTEKGSST